MKGRKTPRVKEVSMMLLTCRRESSATAQPRAGVRVNPAESAAEVSMPSSLYRADAACQVSHKSPIRPPGPWLAFLVSGYGDVEVRQDILWPDVLLGYL